MVDSSLDLGIAVKSTTYMKPITSRVAAPLLKLDRSHSTRNLISFPDRCYTALIQLLLVLYCQVIKMAPPTENTHPVPEHP